MRYLDNLINKIDGENIRSYLMVKDKIWPCFNWD